MARARATAGAGTPDIGAPTIGTPTIGTQTSPPDGTLKRALPFLALGVLSLGALGFDLTLPLRLPASQDYAEAAAFLRGHIQHGDAVQLWPPWLEEARLYVDTGPVLAEEDLAHADYPGAQKLWLLELPGAPFSGSGKAEDSLRARGASRLGEPAKFGPLALSSWDLHAPPLAADLAFATQPREWHEVQYVSRACRAMPVGGPGFPARITLTGAAGSTLHLRAGVMGEQAYNAQLEPIRVEAFSGERKLAELVLTRSRDPQPAWIAADVPTAGYAQPVPAALAPAGDAANPSHPGVEPMLQLELRAATQGGFRPPICASAWTTR